MTTSTPNVSQRPSFRPYCSLQRGERGTCRPASPNVGSGDDSNSFLTDPPYHPSMHLAVTQILSPSTD
eukprot:5556578-Pyramimonas_sp.AAC.1